MTLFSLFDYTIQHVPMHVLHTSAHRAESVSIWFLCSIPLLLFRQYAEKFMSSFAVPRIDVTLPSRVCSGGTRRAQFKVVSLLVVDVS